MSTNVIRRPRFWICLVVIFAAVLLVIGYEEVRSVNLATFEELHETLVFGIPVVQTTHEGSFAKFVRQHDLGGSAVANWRVFYSKSVFSSISPHYTYHSVPHLLNSSIDDAIDSSIDEKLDFSRKVISLVRKEKLFEFEDEVFAFRDADLNKLEEKTKKGQPKREDEKVDERGRVGTGGDAKVSGGEKGVCAKKPGIGGR